MEVTSLSTFHMIEAIIQRSVNESATVNSWLVQKQRWQWHSTLALDGAFPCLITKQYIATVLTVLLFGIMNPLSKNQQQSLPTVGHPRVSAISSEPGHHLCIRYQLQQRSSTHGLHASNIFVPEASSHKSLEGLVQCSNLVRSRKTRITSTIHNSVSYYCMVQHLQNNIKLSESK